MKIDPIDEILSMIDELMPETVYLTRNPERYDKVMDAVRDIKSYIESITDDVSFAVEPDKLLGNMLGLEIITPSISFSDVCKLRELVGEVDTIDIEPTADGDVAITLGFNNVWIPAPPAKK